MKNSTDSMAMMDGETPGALNLPVPAIGPAESSALQLEIKSRLPHDFDDLALIKAKVVAMLRLGFPIATICSECGVTRGTVKLWQSQLQPELEEELEFREIRNYTMSLDMLDEIHRRICAGEMTISTKDAAYMFAVSAGAHQRRQELRIRERKAELEEKAAERAEEDYLRKMVIELETTTPEITTH